MLHASQQENVHQFGPRPFNFLEPHYVRSRSKFAVLLEASTVGRLAVISRTKLKSSKSFKKKQNSTHAICTCMTFGC